MAKTKIRRVVSAVNNLGGRTGLTKSEIADYLRAYYGGSTPMELTRSLRLAVAEGFITTKQHRYYSVPSNDFIDTDIVELRRRRRRGGSRRRSKRRGGRRRHSRRGKRHYDDDEDDDYFTYARRRRKAGHRRRRARRRGRSHAAQQPGVQNLAGQDPPPQQSNEPQNTQ